MTPKFVVGMVENKQNEECHEFGSLEPSVEVYGGIVGDGGGTKVEIPGHFL
jgi:hypothetical protein